MQLLAFARGGTDRSGTRLGVWTADAGIIDAVAASGAGEDSVAFFADHAAAGAEVLAG